MSRNVQFQGDFTQITLSKKNKIVIELPEETNIAKIVEIAKFRGGRLNIIFGDPQMEMPLEIPDPQQRTGIQGKIDSRGVVESVQTDKDVEESDLFQQTDDDAELEREDAEAENEETEEEAEVTEEQEPSDAYEDDGSNDEDLIEFIDRGDFRQDAPIQEIPEPDKDQIEAYILNYEPRFEDIPYDFPTLLQRKRSGDTWIEIAKELRVNSRDLSKVYGEYKQRVTKMITGVA